MSDKQAVLLIHGIGEQRPMQTLRGFVRAVWTTDARVHHPYSPPTVWSKPDTVSGSYELRRLTTGQNRAGVRTDFFELYWAHLMEGTKVAHVVSWARILLLRSPRTVPRHLIGVWLLIVTLAPIVGLAVYGLSQSEWQKLIQLPVWLSTILGLLGSALVGSVVIQVIGDAARYLNPAPPNIKSRQEIRTKAIEVLRKLHQSDYDRIILVGHSLGSVIGYDALTYIWAEFNTMHAHPDAPQQQHLEELERLLGDESTTREQYRAAQRAYLGELKANGNQWRVTDFITLGSPLAHATILLAKDAAGLSMKQAEREFPTCPPVTEDGRISYSLPYKTAAGTARRLQVPHHAAVFGPTRWTNLYFPNRFVFQGDLIGGPLAPIFGRGIRDLPVHTAERHGLRSHNFYWTIREGIAASHVDTLRAALDLAEGLVE
jgi:hypothetical protein